jgi:hypothetical protein
MKSNRNDPCTCGSGRKYKHCCERKQEKREKLRVSMGRAIVYLSIPIVLIALVAVVAATLRGPSVAEGEPQQIWSVAHGHWHYLLPDGSEVEMKPGMVWSKENARFEQLPPLPEAARKHDTSRMDQHLRDVEGSLGE